MKLLLIGYHHLADGFKGAMDALKVSYDYEIEFFPFTSYKDDYKSELTTDLLIKFINRQIDDDKIHYNSIYDPLTNVDIVLWWNLDTDIIDKDILQKIKKETGKLFIFYSWDDPYHIELCENDGLYQSIDICYSCCQNSLSFYKMNGCHDTYYAYPGFDQSIHHPDNENSELDKKYDCDISIVCTNLYTKTNSSGFNVDRKKLLDKISADPSINLHIYGTDHIGKLYPNHYKGFINFKDSHKVFSHSKINLNTHIRRNGGKYINERTTQILGSGGLLMIDDIAGLDELMNRYEHCVVLNEKNPVEQIKSILKNYDYYEQIKINGLKHAVKNFTWNKWAQIINQGIQRKIADKEIKIHHQPKNKLNYETIQKLIILSKLLMMSHDDNSLYLKQIHKLSNKYNVNFNSFLNENMNLINNRTIEELI